MAPALVFRWCFLLVVKSTSLRSDGDISAELKKIYISSACRVTLESGKEAAMIFVPFPLLKNVQRIHSALQRELEKKLDGAQVVFIGERRILPKPGRKNRTTGVRPRSRTLTKVYESFLDDLVFPTYIVGKKTRYSVDGARTLRVALPKEKQSDCVSRLEGFSTIYRKLTGSDVQFLFE
ncbi:Ribosomal protein S7e like protein [Aduncisulcus paluster]|uniref:40S ribosomal protein S7 n=1 Tax=Aduncisulcus paluster TaxID=2918883 RepID=A0ABQ5KPK6_9EUKA|nr:Ribosomal protein S7e like protein [Aduncisulcus paluster]